MGSPNLRIRILVPLTLLLAGLLGAFMVGLQRLEPCDIDEASGHCRSIDASCAMAETHEPRLAAIREFTIRTALGGVSASLLSLIFFYVHLRRTERSVESAHAEAISQGQMREEEQAQFIERMKREREALERSEEKLKDTVAALDASHRATLNMMSDAHDARLTAERARESLVQNEEKLRSVLETAPNRILSIDRNGRILFSNHDDENLNPTGNVGHLFRDLVCRRHHTTIDRAIRCVFEIGNTVECELELAAGDADEETWNLIRIGPVRHDGRIDSATIVSTDITPRKRTEAKLARDMAARESLNNLLRLSLSATSVEYLIDGVLDELLSLDFLNIRKRCALFLVNGDHGELTLRNVQDRGERLHNFCSRVACGSCLCGRAAESGLVEFSSDLDERHEVRYDGIVPHGHYCVPLCIDRQVLGVMVFHVPAGTERREQDEEFLRAACNVVAGAIQRLSMEDSLRRKNDELEQRQQQLVDLNKHMDDARAEAVQAAKSKSEFIANMSHEIRTPMTAILGWADSLMDSRATDDEKRKAVDTIRRNGKHLLEIINDILDISKIEAGKMDVERIRCSPLQIITEVQSLMQDRAEAKGLAFDVEHVPPIPETIQSDPIRLRQILVNLVGNAIKFTEEGGVRLQARLVEQVGGEPVLQFDVIDTGVGITEEQAVRLFEPFTQADSSTTRKYGGTGLGLSISRRLAQDLGGDIEIVSSEAGVGTRFRARVAAGAMDNVTMLYLPSVQEWQGDHSLEIDDEADHPDLSGCRVLLVEDGEDNQDYISTILQKAGATVELAENGEIAMNRILEGDASSGCDGPSEPYDVILMDMQMPVMDGYVATESLRRRGYRGAIVALTAHAGEDDREQCLGVGCDDFISKPIDKSRLFETVSRYGATQLAKCE